MEQRFGVIREGATLGMVRAAISAVKDGWPSPNTFIREVKVRCTVCGDAVRMSEHGDAPPQCRIHRRKA